MGKKRVEVGWGGRGRKRVEVGWLGRRGLRSGGWGRMMVRKREKRKRVNLSPGFSYVKRTDI